MMTLARPVAAPIPSFKLGHPQVTPTLGFSASMPTEALTERHRPATLADVVGQSAAVHQLESFLEAPAPKAFLFTGPTGVGKTTVARALANDLGVSADWGFHFIKSAEADADAVDDALRMLRLSCPVGSGWRYCLVDEADLMSPKASHLWLSALEDLPPRCVVVFTTNRPEHFPDRFVDRCETIDFASDANLLWLDAENLVGRVWLAETGRTDAPRMTEIPGLVDKHGRLSFRRVVAALDPLIRAVAPKRPDAPPVAPTPPTPPVVPSAMPPLKPPAKRRSEATPKPSLKMVAAPRPASTPDSFTTDAGELRRVDAELAALEDKYERIGEILLKMDRKRDQLKATRKRLAKRPSRG